MADIYIQRNDGEWSDVTDGLSVACCDCGLTHNTDYVVLGGRILKRVFRDKRKTAHRRMRKDVKASIKALKGK